MVSASAKLSEEEHAAFVRFIKHLEWSDHVSIERVDGTTTVTGKDDTGAYLLERSMKDGLFHVRGYSEKFVRVEVV
jgi:hypothetical protein